MHFALYHKATIAKRMYLATYKASKLLIYNAFIFY